MTRPKLARIDRRNIKLTTYVRPAEADKFAENCKLRGMTVAECLRGMVQHLLARQRFNTAGSSEM